MSAVPPSETPASPKVAQEAAQTPAPEQTPQPSTQQSSSIPPAASAPSANPPATPNSKKPASNLLSTPPPIHSELASKTAPEDSSAIAASPSSSASAAHSVSSPTGSVPASVAFVTSNWMDVQMNELVQRENLVYVDGDTTVEKAFATLDQYKFTSLPIKVHPEDPSVSDTFDYADLNAYLLMVMGLIEPVNTSKEFAEYVHKARSGQVVPVSFAAHLGVKNELISLKSTDTIASAVEILGEGVHRIAIADVTDPRIVVGILSQRRLIRFIWEHSRRFKTLDPLFQTSLSDLGIGPKKVVSINGDRPVIDAFKIMHDDGVSSMAVTDNHHNLLGNISIVDVRLITKSSQKHMLRTPCKHFLSIILNERGLHDGQDSYPVFHVTLGTSVGRTIAKLVATKAHRLWIVQPPAPPSAPSSASSAASPATAPAPLAASALSNVNTTAGQLIGVISLTDIINILAKQVGKANLDPHAARRQRRRSSSSSSRSYDKFRRSISIERNSGR